MTTEELARIHSGVMRVARERRAQGVLQSEADFFCGALTVLSMAASDDQVWMPPSWYVGLMTGRSIIDAGYSNPAANTI